MVTGSSSGIGRSIALAFAAQGTKLVVCADLQPGPRISTGMEEHADPNNDRPTHEIICDLYGEERALYVSCDVGVEEGEVEKRDEERGGEGDEVTEPQMGVVGVAISEAVRKAGRLDM